MRERGSSGEGERTIIGCLNLREVGARDAGLGGERKQVVESREKEADIDIVDATRERRAVHARLQGSLFS